MPRMRSAVGSTAAISVITRDLEGLLPQQACLIVCMPVERNHRQRAQHLRLAWRISELAARLEALLECAAAVS